MAAFSCLKVAAGGFDGFRITFLLRLGQGILGFSDGLFHLLVVFLDVVKEGLRTEHIAMVGHSERRLPIGNGLFYKTGHRRKTVEQGI